MSKLEWDTYAICTGCGHNHHAWRGELFFVSGAVCWKCGEPKSRWPIKIMRWVPTGQLLKPSTWGTGHWVTRSDPLLKTERNAA